MFKQLLLAALSVVSVSAPVFAKPVSIQQIPTEVQYQVVEYCRQSMNLTYQQLDLIMTNPDSTPITAKRYGYCLLDTLERMGYEIDLYQLRQENLRVSNPDFNTCGYRLCETPRPALGH